MGLISAGDQWVARSDEAFEKVKNMFKLVDDLLIFARTPTEAVQSTKEILKCAEEAGITMSRKKIQTGRRVEFGGYIIQGGTGVFMNPKRVEAIRKFPRPKCTTDVRAFTGLCNALGRFCPDYTKLMQKLYELTTDNSKAKTSFGKKEWTDEHTAAFERAKDLLCQSGGQVLKHYDPNRDLVLITDASSDNGMGFALVQFDSDNIRPRLIECGSRTLTGAEKNYSSMELEATGIVWALLKLRKYCYGRKVQVRTDHRGLESIHNKQYLDMVINARVRRILTKVADYTFEVVYLPGRFNQLADAFSRYPILNGDKCPIA